MKERGTPWLLSSLSKHLHRFLKILLKRYVILISVICMMSTSYSIVNANNRVELFTVPTVQILILSCFKLWNVRNCFTWESQFFHQYLSHFNVDLDTKKCLTTIKWQIQLTIVRWPNSRDICMQVTQFTWLSYSIFGIFTPQFQVLGNQSYTS